MSEVKLQVLSSKVVEHYLLMSEIDIGEDSDDSIVRLKDVENQKIKEIAQKEHEYHSNGDEPLTGDEIIIPDTFGGIVILKHEPTNTTLVIEMPSSDHDGNPFYLIDESGDCVDITEDTKFTNTDIATLLSGVIKLHTKTTVSGSEITFTPNNKCWVDSTLSCFGPFEVEDETEFITDEQYEELEEKEEVLENRIEESSYIEVLLKDYSGKIIYTEVDDCGGIFELKELNSLDEVEYTRVHYCL